MDRSLSDSGRSGGVDAVPIHGRGRSLAGGIAAFARAASIPFAAASVCVIAWGVSVRLLGVPEYIVPSPSAVGSRLFGDLGYFAFHGMITLMESLGGFALGSAAAIAAAVAMAHARILERIIYPIALLVKVTPIVAVAPLFVIWFGLGSFPKIMIAALITFFPVMVNVFVGLKSVNPTTLEFFRLLDAGRLQILLKLRAPSALPYLFAAFRIAVPLSVIGAVVGEWFTGDRGLGSVIIVAHHNIDTPTLFSAVAVLAVIGLGLTGLTALAERRLLFWHESHQGDLRI